MHYHFVKRVYSIVAQLVTFVILPASSLGALELNEHFQFSFGWDLVKKPEFAASYQPGYRVAEGIELSLENGLILGVAGIVTQTGASAANAGVVYRGFTAIGAKLHAGYVYPRPLGNLLLIGASARLTAQFARYFQTDLLFFYLAAGLSPELSFSLGDAVWVRVGAPVSYGFREALSYHIRFGAEVAFLIG
jgi:hypothetical protein